MKPRKRVIKTEQHEQQTNNSVEKEKEVCEEPKKSWWGLLKYLLLLFVPAVLNHAALFREATVLKPNGEMYDIGWRQKLFMSCSGRGPPTVILDAPTGKSSDAWALIAPEIAKVAKTCIYDRAGLGFSDKPFRNWSEPEQQQSKRGQAFTSERMVEDFHRLFTSSSDQPKPFILVGAELGAVNVRFYTQMFENDVASLVLVNPLVEGMFSDEWSKVWYEGYVSSHQALQFSAAIGVNRLALILGLMKVPMKHKSLPLNVTMRQKYLLCKPGHLSSGVDELFFANESLAQMRMVWRVKPFPRSVGVSIVTSGVYHDDMGRELNQVWSSARDHISNTLHPGSERVHLSGSAESALLQNSETIVKIIKRHVDKWKQRTVKPKRH